MFFLPWHCHSPVPPSHRCLGQWLIILFNMKGFTGPRLWHCDTCPATALSCFFSSQKRFPSQRPSTSPCPLVESALRLSFVSQPDFVYLFIYEFDLFIVCLFGVLTYFWLRAYHRTMKTMKGNPGKPLVWVGAGLGVGGVHLALVRQDEKSC